MIDQIEPEYLEMQCPHCGERWGVSTFKELGTLTDDDYDKCPECELWPGDSDYDLDDFEEES